MGIVTMTESNTDHQENEIRTLGIIYYMIKPINKQVLKDILDHVARRKTLRSSP
jgi:response regulator of citrate/malate metabolism